MISDTVLCTEDSESDRHRLSRLWKRASGRPPIIVTSTGELLELLSRCERGERDRPRLILLDFASPGVASLDVLTKIKDSPDLRSIPVVMLATSTNPEDVRACFRLHANGYVAKEVDEERYAASLRNVYDFWFATATVVR